MQAPMGHVDTDVSIRTRPAAGAVGRGRGGAARAPRACSRDLGWSVSRRASLSGGRPGGTWGKWLWDVRAGRGGDVRAWIPARWVTA